MGPKIFVAAAFLTWASTVSVHASTDISMTGRAFTGAASRADAMAEFSDEDPASAKTGEIASLGGAIYSPFADIPKSRRSQGAALERSPKAGDVSMGLTIFVTLAGVAMVGRFLKKTWDDW